MKPIAYVVKVSLPEYLSSLPIPDTFGGWFKLGFKDWLSLIPPVAFTSGAVYVFYKAFCPLAHSKHQVNLKVKKDVAKVVDTVEIEDIADKAVFCRCWRSKNWPYCDGSHGLHNNITGDNVGPIVVTHKK